MARPPRGHPDLRDRGLGGFPALADAIGGELLGTEVVGQLAEADSQQRVIRIPAGFEAAPDKMPVQLGQRLALPGISPRARAKAAAKRTDDDLPVHSFASQLADLATICLNTIAPADPAVPGFRLVTTPTPLQRRALDLLGVSHRLGVA